MKLIESSAAALTGSTVVQVFTGDEKRWDARDLDVIAPLTAGCFTEFVTFLTAIKPHIWCMRKHESLDDSDSAAGRVTEAVRASLSCGQKVLFQFILIRF
jgi:hypothetical protein